MPKVQPHPLKYNQLLKKLKDYNIVEAPKRGKGSERLLILEGKHSQYRGPQIPIKHHGQGTEIKTPVINAILRRFNITPDDFWK